MALLSQIAHSLRIKRKSGKQDAPPSRLATAPVPSIPSSLHRASPAASVHDTLDFSCAGDRSSRSSRFFATLSRANTSWSFLPFNRPGSKSQRGQKDTISELDVGPSGIRPADTEMRPARKGHFLSAKRFKRFSSHKNASLPVFQMEPFAGQVSPAPTLTSDLSLRAAHVQIISDVTKAFEGDAQQCPTLRSLVSKKQERPGLVDMPAVPATALDSASDGETLVATTTLDISGNVSDRTPTSLHFHGSPLNDSPCTIEVKTPTLGPNELPPTRPQSQIELHTRSASCATLLPDDSTSIKGHYSTVCLSSSVGISASSFYSSTPAETERISIISDSPDVLAGFEWLRLEESSRRVELAFGGPIVGLIDVPTQPTYENMRQLVSRAPTPLFHSTFSEHPPPSPLQDKKSKRIASPFAQALPEDNDMPRPKRPILSVDTSSVGKKHKGHAVVPKDNVISSQSHTQPVFSNKPLLRLSPSPICYAPMPIRSVSSASPLAVHDKKRYNLPAEQSPFTSGPSHTHPQYTASVPDDTPFDTTSHRQVTRCIPSGAPVHGKANRLSSPHGLHSTADVVLRKIENQAGTWQRPPKSVARQRDNFCDTTMAHRQYLTGNRQHKRPTVSVERCGTFYDAGMF